MSASSTSPSGGLAPGSSRSSGGQNGRPSAANRLASSAASGSGPRASTYSGDPVARTSSVPSVASLATTSDHGDAVEREPDARDARSARGSRRSEEAPRTLDRVGRSIAGTTTQTLDASSQNRRAGRRHVRPLPPRSPWLSARLRSTVRPALPFRRPRERRRNLRLRCRPDAGNVAQRSRRDGDLELRDGRDPERPGDTRDALRADAVEASVAHELGRKLGLQRAKLLDLAGRHELAQLGLDPRADAAQLADTALANELRDRGRQRADELGRSRCTREPRTGSCRRARAARRRARAGRRSPRCVQIRSHA